MIFQAGIKRMNHRRRKWRIRIAGSCFHPRSAQFRGDQAILKDGVDGGVGGRNHRFLNKKDTAETGHGNNL